MNAVEVETDELFAVLIRKRIHRPDLKVGKYSRSIVEVHQHPSYKAETIGHKRVSNKAAARLV